MLAVIPQKLYTRPANKGDQLQLTLTSAACEATLKSMHPATGEHTCSNELAGVDQEVVDGLVSAMQPPAVPAVLQLF